MIISASRRTDIPACFAGWFMNRIREGYVCTRNPFRYHQVSRISLAPDVVDGIVFWSKNPAPLMAYLDELKPYMYYFQYTLNAYGPEIETGIPAFTDRMDTFRRLAERLGDRRVIWRYDPIILGGAYSVAWHIRQFEDMANRLKGYTKRCVISFLDAYPGILKEMRRCGIREAETEEMKRLAAAFSKIADQCGITLTTCCEAIDLSAFGIGHASCIDKNLLSELLGCGINGKKDRGQRAACGCVESIDIGSYHTCSNGCVYCYAQGRKAEGKREKKTEREMVELQRSPVLGTLLTGEDRVIEREGKSLKQRQISLFDLE